MQHNIISAENLTRQFKIRGNKKLLRGLFDPQWQYKQAVKGIGFGVGKGEAVAFLGPNGAGKTTTTKMLAGLILPSGGKLRVLGHTPFGRDYAFLRKIGLVMGNKAGLNWDLSAAQSYELIKKIYDIDDEVFSRRVSDLTKNLRVEHVLNTQVRKLSLGERMKLELIGAILHNPEILFLDEPTIGLDIDSKKTVRQFLRQLHADGKTLLLTSHDMDDVLEVCQRVIVINHGEIIFDDSMETLYKQYSRVRYARLEFSDAVPPREFASRFGEVISLDRNVLVLGTEKQSVMAAATKISNQYPIADITIEQVPLEVIISDLYHAAPY